MCVEALVSSRDAVFIWLLSLGNVSSEAKRLAQLCVFKLQVCVNIWILSVVRCSPEDRRPVRSVCHSLVCKEREGFFIYTRLSESTSPPAIYKASSDRCWCECVFTRVIQRRLPWCQLLQGGPAICAAFVNARESWDEAEIVNRGSVWGKIKGFLSVYMH